MLVKETILLNRNHFKIYFILIIAITAIFLNFKDKDKNNNFSIDDYKGKWLVINYWAEWCAPCVTEIHELNDLDSEYGDYLNVLGVNFDRLTDDELNSVVTKMEISFVNLKKDPSSILKLSRPSALPTTYIFNKTGDLSYKLVGPQTKKSLLEKMRIEKNTF